MSKAFPILYGERVNNAAIGSIGKKAIAKHLQPGVVRYENEDGTFTTYLLELDAIEAMRPTAAGIPVVGKSGSFDHVKVEQGKAYDGVVTDSFWDGQSGWEAFNVDKMNDATAQACAKGFQASCAYVPTETDGKSGVWHNVPYDEKILNGRYTHVAVVPNPRYEGATIELLNSTGGGIVNKVLKAALSLIPMKDLREVFNSLDDEDKKKVEAEKKNADEKAAKRKSAQDAYDASMKNASSDEDRVKAKEAFEKMNAEIDAASGDGVQPVVDGKLPPQPLGGGDVVPEPGIPGQDPLKANASGDAAAKAEEEKARQALEAKNAADKEKADKEAMEKKNADDAAAKKKEADEKEEKEKQNALKVKAAEDAKAEALKIERFNALRTAAEQRGGSMGTPFVGIVSSEEKENLGRDRYGSRQ